MLSETEKHIIQAALQEDIQDGDHTALACIPPHAKSAAKLKVKENGICCGLAVAEEVYRQVEPSVRFTAFTHDGAIMNEGEYLFMVEGPARAILTAERTALNFLQRMSGIATTTAEYAKLIEGTHAKLLDTRKTTPGLRIFEKYAVKTGGGLNHRFGLFDMIMIKDNHVDFAGGIEPAIQRVNEYLKENNKNLRIEIEVRNLNELQEVLQYGNVHRIMLDNFSVSDLKDAVDLIHCRFETEASGGINKNTVRAVAETGVDFISVGALTHQIHSLDLSLVAC